MKFLRFNTYDSEYEIEDIGPDYEYPIYAIRSIKERGYYINERRAKNKPFEYYNVTILWDSKRLCLVKLLDLCSDHLSFLYRLGSNSSTIRTFDQKKKNLIRSIKIDQIFIS